MRHQLIWHGTKRCHPQRKPYFPFPVYILVRNELKSIIFKFDSFEQLSRLFNGDAKAITSYIFVCKLSMSELDATLSVSVTRVGSIGQGLPDSWAFSWFCGNHFIGEIIGENIRVFIFKSHLMFFFFYLVLWT